MAIMAGCMLEDERAIQRENAYRVTYILPTYQPKTYI